jgi:hypothetical protein
MKNAIADVMHNYEHHNYERDEANSGHQPNRSMYIPSHGVSDLLTQRTGLGMLLNWQQ